MKKMKTIIFIALSIIASSLLTFYYLEHSILYIAEVDDASYVISQNIDGCKLSPKIKYSKSLSYSAIWSDANEIGFREIK
jgi:hypothetical protein